MKKLISLAAAQSILCEYGNMKGLEDSCRALGCDGYELIWGGEELPADLPADLTYGYHLTFFPDWLDFWRGDEAALKEKYGNREVWRAFYGGDSRETLLRLYQEDLQRAVSLGAPYVVFHTSDVSIEEGYTYRWRHSHEEVLDASAEVLNLLLDGRKGEFTFLVENQWWPGLTLTDPVQTARLLDAIRYPNKGIMLDTGHLMNCNTALRTQREGVEYISQMLRRHKGYRELVQGVHLHHSLSGEYVKTHTGTLPDDLPPPEDSEGRFGYSYGHILKIDQHRPWTDPAVRELVEEISPHWLVHELSAPNRAAREQAVAAQMEALGYNDIRYRRNW